MPNPAFYFSPIQPDLLNLTVDFKNESTGASSYIWTFGDKYASTETNPSHTYPEMGNRTYSVELIAISTEGCEASISKNLILDEIVLYYIPNAFTSAGDLFS